jgi:hypothetical protein
MFDGIILTWFALTALSVVFVAIDIRSTPESPVLKWGFVIVTLFTGPIGAMLYVLDAVSRSPALTSNMSQPNGGRRSAPRCIA